MAIESVIAIENVNVKENVILSGAKNPCILLEAPMPRTVEKSSSRNRLTTIHHEVLP